MLATQFAIPSNIQSSIYSYLMVRRGQPDWLSPPGVVE